MAGGRDAAGARAVPSPRSTLLVAVGGAAGALLRVKLGLLFPAAGGLPWTTLAVNVSGAFLLAGLLGGLERRPHASAWLRPLLGTGVLGGYTTFSTLSLELWQLLAAGLPGLALVYVAATLLLGLGAAAAGLRIGRRAP